MNRRGTSCINLLIAAIIELSDFLDLVLDAENELHSGFYRFTYSTSNS